MPLSREDRIAALPEHLRALLDERLAGQSVAPDRIRPVPRGGPLPLSFAQQRLWFLHDYDPAGIEYNASVGVRLTGPLDLAALRWAVAELVARHESLRTTFDSVDGVGVQRVAAPSPVPIPVTDLRAVAGRDAELDRLLAAEVAAPFDLRTGPLVRFALWQLADADHVLVMSLHHIVTDGWSMGVLMRDLTALYGAGVDGAVEAAVLPPLPVQYADFAVWQRERCTDEALAADLAYWRSALAGVAPLELPTDRPRPPIRTTAGALHVSGIPAGVTSGLLALSRDRGATLFMTLIAATNVLLSRWSGARDIALGAVATGRDRADTDQVVGFFADTLVIRSTMAADTPFADHLAATKRTVLDAFAHGNVPFERIVDEVAPERDPSRTPLVQALIVLQNTDFSMPTLHGLDVRAIPLPCLAAAFDVTFDFAARDGGIELSIEYNTDLFDAATIDRLARSLRLLLSGLVADPAAPLGVLPITTPEDRGQLVRWNDTTVARPPDGPVHALFEACADRHPDEVAVVCGAVTLSYRDLEERANRLAHHLIELGVRPGTLVGIHAERGPDAVVAILAILKAGGAYVPLDPGYPADRLAFMLADTAMPVVLAQRHLVDRLPQHDAEYVLLDGDWSRYPARRPACPAGQDDLAYVIYTSGSTGTPKGVLIEHRNLCYIAHAWDVHYTLATLRPRFMSVSSLSVDLFFADMLRSIFFGGTFIVCPSDLVTDPAALLDMIEDTGATGLELVPSLLRTVVDEVRGRGTEFPPLDILSVGSEAWRVADCRELLAVLDPRTRVVNAYGGTEATVDSSVFVPHQHNLAGVSVVPVGRPLANTRLYVLDERLMPVPVGVAGELCIAGDGLARGYHNRRELTEERFVAAPFDQGERLYRTGDRGRWLAGGDLEFLGRVDEQLKIRGFRVEPGEVESVLVSHPSIQEAVVVANEANGRRRLVAYLATADAPDTAELRSYVGERLPNYMVPAIFVALDTLPHTPSGKVDRRALPAPEPAEPVSGYAAPESPVEQRLAQIWAEVLGVRRVGVLDNFFELGGDSILSIQVVSLARRAGFVLSSKDIFVKQTIRSLATGVRADRVSAPVDAAAATPGPVILTPVQRWFFETNTAAPWHYTMSVLLDLVDGVDETALRSAVESVVAWHDALEMRYERTQDGWRQRGSGERSMTFDTVELAAGAGIDATVERAATQAQAGLSLANGPLVRAILFRYPDGQARLFLTVHHLVVDGVSWRILLSDLATAYAQRGAGHEVDLGVRTTSFQRWADRLADHVRQGGFDDELAYWRQLDEFPSALPVDLPGPNLAASARIVSARLGPAATDALLHRAAGAYHTQVNDLLISAFGQVLARWTGRERLLIGMEGHGREDILDGVDLSRTVGWFTTHFPVPLVVPAGADPGTLIKSVKEQLRAVPRRGIGYDALRYLTSPDQPGHVLSEQDQPRITFNYLGQWDTAMPGGLITGRQVGVGADQSRDDRRQYLIDVACSVEHGSLEFHWMYSEDVHHEATVQRLAGELVTALHDLVAHCTASASGGRTPSDFPLARLDQAAVDRLGDDVVDVYPLTPVQAGMLFHSLMNPDSGVYVDQMSFVVEDADEPAAVAAAWQAVVDRTPILRTSVLWEGVAEPVQVVHEGVDLPVTYLDWSGRTPEQQEAAALRYEADERAIGIDLREPPLARLAVARLSPRTVRVLRTSHHLLLDGWSTFHVLQDVMAYHAFLRGRRLTPPPERPRFRDYVGWLADRDDTAARQYWRAALSGFDTTTTLPWDRPPTSSHVAAATATVPVPLPSGLLARLSEFARAHHLTVNTIAQGAWAVSLARYSGTSDVCFGVTVSGRPADLAGAEDVIGIFINTLPVRVRVAGGQAVVPWLTALQADQVAVREHGYVSLADVSSWSGLPGGAALFDSIVVFENFPMDTGAAEEQGLRLADLRGVESTSYALNLLAYPGDELAMAISYDPGLFDAATVERLAGHLAHVLDSVPSAAGGSIADLATLAPAERDLMARWNDTGRAVPPATLTGLFEAQADRTPNAAAVLFEDTALTYRELDTRANRLARVLAERGAGPEHTVAVLLPRGLDLVVALYAVHKAGGAYLPVDPEYPDDRIAFLLADAKATVVVTDDDGAGRLPAGQAYVLADSAAVAAQPGGRLVVRCDPGAPAYVIYTSGSTGRPKGVVVPHRGIVNRLLWMQHEFGLRPDDRVLQKTPAGFDVSVWEFFWPLQVGATLVVARPGGHRDPAYLAELIERERITTVHFVPSMLRAFLAEPAAHGLTGLRRVICSGEALAAELWQRFRAVSDVPLYNLYGPTEASVDVTCHRCVPADATGTVPIGRPVWNTQVHVLDEDRRPLPLGAAGELYLGGAQLAAGYLDRPELTAQRFLPDPFGPGDGRLYRTGDLGRWRSDGVLEYLGRTDDQVKIRGFRIEPGEIEAALTEHPAVEAAAVVPHTDRTGNTLLVGYLVPGHVAIEAVRADLARRLPAHLVPALFVPMAGLPLTSSGKIDRKALPEPVVTSTSDTAPRSATERDVAAVLAETLGVDRIGAHDNFFALGGDSIRSIGVAARLAATFGVRVLPRDVFDAPTVAALAELVDRAAGTEQPAIPAARRDGPLPLSFAQQRLWFLHNVAPDSPEYNVAAGLRLSGPLDVGALRAALDAIVARHDALRTTFVSDGGPGAQVVQPDGRAECTLLDVAHEDEVGAHLRAAAARPFDLTTGPLLRVLLLRLPDGDHVLLLSTHHIVTDGWSIGVLTRELSALYRAEPLPDVRLRYADFAVWQRSAPAGVLAADLAFWRTELAGSVPLDLPTDRLRPPVRTGAGALCADHVPADVVTSLTALCAKADVTLFGALAAATQVLLARWSGVPDVMMGTVASGRDRAELVDVVGFFANTLVLRATVDPGLPFTELLARTRDTMARVFAHQNLPFERLVDELDVVRDPSRAPLLSAMMVLQNAPIEPPDLPGLDVTDIRLPSVAAQFDLDIEYVARDGGLDVLVEYDRDLFDAATIEHLAGQLTTLLAEIAADADRPIGRLTATTPAVPSLPVPSPTVPDLIREQARLRPAGVAIIDGDTTVTYRELHEWSASVARELVERGLRPGDVGDVWPARGAAQIVAMLALWQAGGGYRVVDAAPPGDIRFGDVVVPCDPPARPVTGLRPVDVSATVAACVLAAPDGPATVTHGALAASVAGALALLRCGTGDRLRYTHSPSADTSLWELWVPLASGGRVLLGEPSPSDGVTVLTVTATEARALARQGDPPSGALRRVVVYGQAPELPWQVPVLSVWSAAATGGGALCVDGPPATDRVLLGRPLPGRRALVLDGAANPAPVGVPGELCVDDVHTGVLARHLPDGTIEDLGPLGAPTVRGLRVDPRVVESVLGGHPDVADAAVVLTGDDLRAVVVPAAGAAPDHDGLAGYLMARMPAYLVPAGTTVVERLPQSPDGRVDRDALPLLVVDTAPDRAPVAPRTETEHRLAEIWSAVLGVDRVGVEDNFFDLGGESMKVLQVVARVREAGFRISARDLLLRQTIAALATVVAPADESPSDGAGEVSGAVELTPIQRWFFETHTARPWHFTMSILLALAPDTDEAALRTALDALVRQHDALRTTFERSGDGWVQYIPPPGTGMAVRRIDLPALDATAYQDAIGEYAVLTQRSMQPAGPPVQGILFTHGALPPSLLLVAHHLVVDAVSWQVLLADLARGYGQARSDLPADLGPKSTSFQDWAKRQREHARSGGWDDELPYWSAQAPPVTPDQPAVDHTAGDHAAAFVTAELDEQTTEAVLRRLPGVHRARVHDILLAALAVALSRSSAADRVVIGLEGHGREDVFDDVDLSRTVGWFTTIYPVSITVPDRADPVAAIGSVKRELRRVPGHGIGFGALRYLTDSLPAAPLPAVLFNYLGEWAEDTGAGLVRGRTFGVGEDADPAERPPFPLDVVGAVEHGRLGFRWTYATAAYRQGDVQRLADQVADVLRQISVHGAVGTGSAARDGKSNGDAH